MSKEFDNMSHRVWLQEAIREQPLQHARASIEDTGKCSCYNGWFNGSYDNWLPCPACPQGPHPEEANYFWDQVDGHKDDIFEGEVPETFVLEPYHEGVAHEQEESNDGDWSDSFKITSVQFDVIKGDKTLVVVTEFYDNGLGDLREHRSVDAAREEWKLWQERGYRRTDDRDF